MNIHGYKAFYPNMINRYGKKFEEGKIYFISGPLKFGNDGNGFHFCQRLEDVLRYFPAMEEDICIAKVTSLGDVVSYADEYYGYYDMFCTNRLLINKELSREEIVSRYLSMPENQVIRFLQGFRLTSEEIEMFRLRYSKNERILDTISYYQDGHKDTYEKKYHK